jgi:hypothetical protein
MLRVLDAATPWSIGETMVEGTCCSVQTKPSGDVSTAPPWPSPPTAMYWLPVQIASMSVPDKLERCSVHVTASGEVKMSSPTATKSEPEPDQTTRFSMMFEPGGTGSVCSVHCIVGLMSKLPNNVLELSARLSLTYTMPLIGAVSDALSQRVGQV